MKNGFGKILTYIVGIIVAFSAINGFLFSLGNLQRWDYILENFLLIIFTYFVYLTYEINKIKEKIK